MKKVVFIFLFLLLTALHPAAADDGWDDFNGLDKAWDGQKSITNKEFEQAIDTLEEKKNKKEAKKRKKLIKKVGGGGTSLHPDLSPDADIQSLTPVKSETEEDTLLNIPVCLLIDNQPLEKGYYKVIAQRDDNKDIYLMFYQSQYFKGKVKAHETNDDYDEESINFVKLLPYDNNYIKIIFGSLNFNAYAYVQYTQ